MTLDMYAVRRLHTEQRPSLPAEDRYSVQVARGGKPVPGIRPERITGVDEQVMYWRKANHIHAWFVDHVQNGRDDCKRYDVDWEKLHELLSRCIKVIEASKLVDGDSRVGAAYGQDLPKGQAKRKPGKVIEDPAVAHALLPRRRGSFFGSQEYDEGYLDDVVKTRDWIVSMLADCDAGVPGDIYYSSSW